MASSHREEAIRFGLPKTQAENNPMHRRDRFERLEEISDATKYLAPSGKTPA
jgi:hypothetical protein